jgi:hypothetical protein
MPTIYSTMRFISATFLSSATLLTFGLRSLAYENQNRRQALSLGVIWKDEGVSISTHLLPQPEKYGPLWKHPGVSSPNLCHESQELKALREASLVPQLFPQRDGLFEVLFGPFEVAPIG